MATFWAPARPKGNGYNRVEAGVFMLKKMKFWAALSSLAVLTFLVAGQLGVHAGGDSCAYRQLNVYSEVLSHVRNDYVEEPNMPAVTDGALHGLLEALDNDSSYLAPAEYKLYLEQNNHAEFTAGIGAPVAKRFGYGFLVSVEPGSPAEKAGLETGDIIESIDSKSAHEMSVAEIRARMRGIKGSHVDFTIIRARKVEPFKVTVIRDVYTVPSDSFKMLEGNVALIKVYSLA